MLIRRTDKAWATQPLSDDAKRKAFYFYGPNEQEEPCLKPTVLGTDCALAMLSGLSRPAVAAIMQGERKEQISFVV